MGYKIASYTKQSSDGSPLNDSKNVEFLSKFDYVVLEVTPWAKNVDGHVRADVPLKLRELNPNIKLIMYHTTGYDWLGPNFVPRIDDHSARRDIWDIIKRYNAWVYGTDGQVWIPNYNIDFTDISFMDTFAKYYIKLLSSRLFDGIFLDCASTSIAWTNGNRTGGIDVSKWGSLQEMDRRRWDGLKWMVDLISKKGYEIFINGVGPAPGNNYSDFREGLASLISEDEATKWMSTPGIHWLKAEGSGMQEMIKRVASYSKSAIISIDSGDSRNWPPIIP